VSRGRGRHRLEIVPDCSLRIQAHGQAWTMLWEDAPVNPDDLDCPGCGKLLDDVRKLDVFWGVCFGEVAGQHNTHSLRAT
jgi:hypothetical protein